VAALLLSGVTGRSVLPLGKFKKPSAPDGKSVHPIELKWAEPGVKMGQ